jgi:hypothetical protein
MTAGLVRLSMRSMWYVCQDTHANRKAFFANGSVRRIAQRRLQSNDVRPFVTERTARLTYGTMTEGSGCIPHGIDTDTNTIVTDVCAVIIAGGGD